MGDGVIKTCPKCGYEFSVTFGVGFAFPRVYAETIMAARKGKLGKELKIFFKEHNDGATSVDRVALCCDDCGYLAQGLDLTMYIPNQHKPDRLEHGRWSTVFPFEGAEYVTGYDLRNYYDEYARYHHKCKKCHGNMHIVNSDELEKLLCPKCKTRLETTDEICWD